MKAFLEWAGTVCAVTAVCALIHTLTRKTGTGKVMYLISTAAVVCVLISPIQQLVKTATLPQFDFAENQETVLYDTTVTQIQKMTESLLLAQVNEALASYNLKAEKLEIDMDISENDDISITDIRLFIPESNSLHLSWVAQIAEKRLGRAVEVAFINGG